MTEYVLPVVFEQVWRLIRDLKRDNRQPSEIRLGVNEYCEVRKTRADMYPWPLTVSVDVLDEPGVMLMYGVPVRPLPLEHAVSVI